MSTTDQMPVDLDEVQKLCDEATCGPWTWRGYDDGAIELRARLRGGTRVITTMHAQPCVAETTDGALVLLEGACASCRRAYDAPDLDEMSRCEKDENRATIWANSEHGVVEPLNKWAVREAPYRTDVADVTHPDARFIARSRDLIPRLVAELRADRELLLIVGTVIQTLSLRANHGRFPPPLSGHTAPCVYCQLVIAYDKVAAQARAAEPELRAKSEQDSGR